MESVDKRSYLIDKIKSGGIINESGPLRAARLSLTHDLDQANYMAQSELASGDYEV